MSKKDFFTGPRTRVSIDGSPFAFALGVDTDEEILWQAIDVLDNVETAEHVPVGYVTTLSMSQLIAPRKTLKSAGFFPKNGQSPEEHLKNMLNQKDLTVLTEDSQDGPGTFAIHQGCKIGRHSWSSQPRALVSRNVTMVALVSRNVTMVALRQLDSSEIGAAA